MGKISTIENRGAVIAWSPIQTDSDVLAVGTKDSAVVGFDEDHGGELELFHTGITPSSQYGNIDDGNKPTIVGSIKTTCRFACLGWSPCGITNNLSSFSMGLIAGGMVDGTVCLWNPSLILPRKQPLASSSSSSLSKADAALVAKLIHLHGSTAVSALQFNSLSDTSQLLATGGLNGQVKIINLDHPEHPTFTSPDSASSLEGQGAMNNNNKGDVTQVAFNSQVSHILASSYGNGTVTIWDLRQKKPWCELRCEANMSPIADMVWNPTQGLHLITASADDRYPALKLWDLRTSTTMPLETIMEGHTQGILRLSWCPHDDSLLLSCGKDNRTLLWDMHTLRPIADISDEDTQFHSMTSSAASTSSRNKKRYDVVWSPILKGVAATCSFDRKVEIHSILSHATKTGRPPLWMKPTSGVSCGFGGSIISFTSAHKNILISSFVEQPKLKNLALLFQEELDKQDLIGICAYKAESSARLGDVYESQVWGFLQVLFQENPRASLIQYLGFDADTIHSAAMNFTSSSHDSLVSDFKNKLTISVDAVATINQALLMGDFEAAVECCFLSGNPGDALILASCGGPELWTTSQKRYLELESIKRPFLRTLSAVMDNRLPSYIEQSDPSLWHETLAIICTYSPAQEFPSLCDALGDRLQKYGDEANASLCYMCAYNLEKVAPYWKKIMLHAMNVTMNLLRWDLLRDETCCIALHTIMEKVTVFLHAIGATVTLPENILVLFDMYAELLADQGLYTYAAKYCKSESIKCHELKDRLYRCKDGYYCASFLGSVPQFPFAYVDVGVAPKPKAVYETTATAMNGNVHQRYQSSLVSATVNNNSSVSYQPRPTPIEVSAIENTLPAGWISLVDPSSGMAYYANQSTGVTTWDRPLMNTVQPSLNTHPSIPRPYALQQGPTSENTSAYPSSVAPAAKLASKYGDGFVTSASHPELAQQYGNIGTSNPYADARPGTAVVKKIEKAPVSGTPLDPSRLVDVISPQDKGMTDGLLSYSSTLSSLNHLAPTDRKILMEAEKSISVFVKRLAKQDVSRDVVEKVKYMWSCLQNRDFNTANTIQNGLVNTDWKEHKDWLKGLKFLIQIAAKYM